MVKNQNSITVLNDIVDTLKLQFYPNHNLTIDEIKKFNDFVDGFVILKTKAMEIKNPDNQKRYVKTDIDGTKFNVMATSQSNFNVVLQNGDFSIGLLKIGKHYNPIIKVEFRAEFLLRNGYKIAIDLVKDCINNLIEKYLIKVSEIHLAKDIQGYEFSTFDFHRIKTLSKTKTIFHNDISSEFYFGNRFTGFSIGKGDELLRIYNKTTEINQKKEKAFIQVLSWNYKDNFNPNRNVWRIEFQLRRERLKELMQGSGLYEDMTNVINSISNLWAYCVSRFVHKDLTNQEVHEQITQVKILKNGTFKYLSPETLRQRFRNAEPSYVWDSIQSFNNKIEPKLQRAKDISKPEVEYVKNAFKAVLSTFIKLKRGAFDSNELSKILHEADKECREKHSLTLVDKARLNTLDYMVKANAFYNHSGIIEQYFYDFKKDFVNNIKDTFAILENESSTLTTFEEFNKKLYRV